MRLLLAHTFPLLQATFVRCLYLTSKRQRLRYAAQLTRQHFLSMPALPLARLCHLATSLPPLLPSDVLAGRTVDAYRSSSRLPWYRWRHLTPAYTRADATFLTSAPYQQHSSLSGGVTFACGQNARRICLYNHGARSRIFMKQCSCAYSLPGRHLYSLHCLPHGAGAHGLWAHAT